MPITSQQIRQKYLDFMKSKGHAVVPSSPLIPENDPTTLFTGSGMQPMVPYLLWEKHPLGTRIADSQKSFRTADIEDIWDNRHTTFFEMLGNWSFGDYFKVEQVEWMFEFLTKELGLNPEKLYVTVHRGNEGLGIAKDFVAVDTWKRMFAWVGIDAQDADFAEEKGMQWARIFYYDDKKNWWSRAGVPGNMPVGEPGGPDSEMFWDFGVHRWLHEVSEWKSQPCHPNCDCGRFLEIGNNVFMQFIKTANGFEELKNKNIDFGWGLERLAVAMLDNPDVFLWDLFAGIRAKIENLSGKKYGEKEEETKAFRVIMDHLRAATFLIGDGAAPSNKDQGYFTRRLIRRAIRFAAKLGINVNFTRDIAEVVITEYGAHYTNLVDQKANIMLELEEEEKQFRATLEKWLKEFEKMVATLEGNSISGQQAFHLYDTFGFPVEITRELAEEKKYSVDMEGFKKAFEHHQELSRAGSEQKFKGGLADNSEITVTLHSATHLMLAGLRKYLGDHVHQAGSNITPERLRFDFTHPEPVTKEQLQMVEDYVNEAIQADATVVMTEMDKEEAKAQWVEGSFWERYPERVKVYKFQSADGRVFSQELCWGPHVPNTGIMGKFKIQKEESSSRWVRRIKAVLEK